MIKHSHVWAEIDLSSLEYNYKQLKKCAPAHVCVIAVVKANAYGHGMVPVARKVLACGVDMLAVDVVDEADVLRGAGIDAPIMVLSRTLPQDIQRVLDGGYIQNIGSLQEADALSRAALVAQKIVRVHIEVDTGMSRLGIVYDDAISDIQKIVALPGLDAEGILTHLADADRSPSTVTESQLARFEALVMDLQRLEIKFTYIHYANSGGVVNTSSSLCNTIRPGISLYGYLPSSVNVAGISLRPLMALKTKVIALRELAQGDRVSYNGIWVAKRASRIAVLSTGYGDGYPRGFSGKGFVVLNGKMVPVIGRVCMSHLFVLIDSLPDVAIGDTAVLYGGAPGENIDILEAARLIDTIPYELTCRISPLVQRIYT